MQDWDTTHWMGHILSFFGMAGSILGILPALAGGAACVYYCLQIYESETVRQVVTRWRERRLHRKGQSLRAQRKRIDDTLRHMGKRVEKEDGDA